MSQPIYYYAAFDNVVFSSPGPDRFIWYLRCNTDEKIFKLLHIRVSVLGFEGEAQEDSMPLSLTIGDDLATGAQSANVVGVFPSSPAASLSVGYDGLHSTGDDSRVGNWACNYRLGLRLDFDFDHAPMINGLTGNTTLHLTRFGNWPADINLSSTIHFAACNLP